MIIPKNIIQQIEGRTSFHTYDHIHFIQRMVIEKNNTVTIDGNPLTDSRKKIIHIDSESFKCIALSFFCDKNCTYGLTYIEKSQSVKFFLSKIKNVDLETFKQVSLYYAQDKNRSYYGPGGKIVKEVNLQLFYDNYTIMEPTSWNKDYNPEDYKSSISFSDHVILGKKHVYFMGKILKDSDATTFKRPHQGYYIDKFRVYWKHGPSIKAIEGVDMESLIFFKNSGYYCTDKYQPLDCYVYGNKLGQPYFDSFKPYFEAQRNQLSKEYWWYKMENMLQRRP